MVGGGVVSPREQCYPGTSTAAIVSQQPEDAHNNTNIVKSPGAVCPDWAL